MNREMRRKMKSTHTKPQHAAKRIVPSFIDYFQQFDEIDKLAQKLDHGALEFEGAHPIMTSGKGETYRILPALEGWMEYWSSLASKHGIAYDDRPMRTVSRRLENAMPLTPEHVAGFKRVVAAQRALFRAIPRGEISSQANTVQIKLLMEDMR
jgi:hypothetical protein